MTETLELTKAQEIEMIEKFYAKLPVNSYLKSILEGIPERAAGMISNDFGYSLGDTLTKLQQEKEVLRAEIREGDKRAVEVKNEVRKLERDAERLNEALKDIRNQARKIVAA